MHTRTHQISRIERVASLAAAAGATLGAALLVFAALVPHFVSTPVAAPTVDDRHVSERLMYVVPRTDATPSSEAASVVHEPLNVRAGAAPRVASNADTASRELPHARDASPPSEPTTAPTSSSARSSAGTPAAGGETSFRLPGFGPYRVDSVVRLRSESLSTALATGRLIPPPLTQAEKDAKWREEAFAVVAARGAGEPVRTVMAGGSIPIPLPFGGPSTKQRQRDRAIFAELKESVALRQKRVDSVVAARRRRLSDSLAQVAESLRLGTRPQP